MSPRRKRGVSKRSRNGMEMKEILENIINRNITTNKGKQGFRAGGSVYANLWARDFLYPAPFLMSQPVWRDAVADHIFLILDHARTSDFMMPKELDTMNPDWRVVRGFFRTLVGLEPEELPMKGEWHKHFTDTMGSDAIDTNLLTINAALELAKYPGYKKKVLARKQELLNGMKYYRQFIDKQGLIHQMKYSDFQDSSARVGVTFLTNLLFWKVLKELEDIGFVQKGHSKRIRDSIIKTFWMPDRKLYRGIKGRKYMNIDANLLAIDWGFDTRKLFWNAIKGYKPWWRGVLPGPPTVPKQPISEKAICVRVGGIPGYHDEYVWSWVMGIGAKVAYKMGDCKVGDEIIQGLKEIVERDKTVYDSYEYNPRTKTAVQVVTYGFRAEYDWTWGASYMLDALKTRSKYCD